MIASPVSSGPSSAPPRCRKGRSGGLGIVSHHKAADRDGDPHSPMISGYARTSAGSQRDVHDGSSRAIRTGRFRQGAGYVPRAQSFAAGDAAGHALPDWRLAWSSTASGPTMTLAHATFCINTVNHMFGAAFDTVDESRNNPIIMFSPSAKAGTTTTIVFCARRAFYCGHVSPTIRAMVIPFWSPISPAGAGAHLRRGPQRESAARQPGGAERRMRRRYHSSWRKSGLIPQAMMGRASAALSHAFCLPLIAFAHAAGCASPVIERSSSRAIS